MAKDNKVSMLMEAIRNHNGDEATKLIKVLTPEQLSETSKFVFSNSLHQAVAYQELEVLKLFTDKATDEVINSSNVSGYTSIPTNRT